MTHTPLVSIGLPVYNGELYVQEALESLVRQTFSDFELIVSDNCSSDSTPRFCREFAREDPRIRYVRFEQNMGAAHNYNHVFALARGTYFKWAAHDDLCEPRFLERCVAALESDLSAVLAYPRVVIIDAEGRPLLEYEEGKSLQSDDPAERFVTLMTTPGECNAVFGLIRASVLRKTPRIATYNASDRNLLAELALHGRFREVPEPLFLRRDHPARPLPQHKSDAERVAWYDPVLETRIVLPHWRQHFEYARSVSRVSMPLGAKLRCYSFIAKSANWDRAELGREVVSAGRTLRRKLRRRRRTGATPTADTVALESREGYSG